jgi:stearoyl-CoA desaturase (delta-9 desaturase)
LPLSWPNIFFLSLVHVVGLGGTAVYLSLGGYSHAALVIALVGSALSIFSLSAGYHRLFAHRAYEAHPLLRAALLAIGAGTFQNSALVWAADHRRHHKRTDSALDPYDARQGFWHSHVGWVLRKTPVAMEMHPVPDLERDFFVRFQHRFYPWVGITFGLLLPTLVGLAFGDPWGGFILGGAARLVFVYHVTFSINSFAHMLGTQPYSDRNTSRDSFIAALLSMGEGYHNFHHTFPVDYRNGVRGYQFDPSKWTIRALASVGLARNLKRTPGAVVLRARLKMDARRLEARPLPDVLRERVQLLKQALDEKIAQWHELLATHETAQGTREREVLRRLKAEIRQIRRNVLSLYNDWQALMRSLEPIPVPVRA